jgi:hypothetical protein
VSDDNIILQELAALRADNEIMHLRLEESTLAQRLIALDDVGWTALFGPDYDEDAGPTLAELHKVSDKLRPEAALNPLQLRHSYVFGRGLYLTALDKAEPYVTDTYNKQALFSVDAYAVGNLALFTDGNFLVLRDEATNLLTVVPLKQIEAVATDENDNAKIQYVLRAWTANGKDRRVWYPLARFKKTRVGRGKRRTQTGGIKRSISVGGKPVPVSQDSVIYVHSSNRQAGWTWGLPDSLAALVWSQAYKEYLRDNAQLVKALSQLAWKVSAATKAGADNAAAKVTVPGIGGTAVVGPGSDVNAVSRGSSVDFGNGQPLAALVATSFGVPVIALLSSPGSTGGSYGAATTLDEPTLKGMKAIQDSWKSFYEEILTDMGAASPGVSFPNISQDPTYRESQSIAQAYADGRLFQEEAREATLELLDVQRLKQGLPKPDDFNVAGLAQAARDDAAKQAKASADAAAKVAAQNPQAGPPGQGKTGPVPGGNNQNTTDHSGDKSQTKK